MSARAQIGVTGLAVMGRNLARNFARHGYTVAVHNRSYAKTESLIAEAGTEGDFVPSESMADFVASLERPRKVVIMVKAGAATDAVIDELVPLLEEGDIVVDAGNAHFPDTIRREKALAALGLHFVGTGVSGGEEGALNGPSIMPGGTRESYQSLGPILEDISAKVDGVPCCTYVGPDSAGHFVKMVHNGIEYADMQLIAEAYDLLKQGLGASAQEIGEIFAQWNTGDLGRSSSRSPRTCSSTSTRRPARPSSTSCSTRRSRRAPAAGRCRTASTSACRSRASPRRRSRARCPARSRSRGRSRRAARRRRGVDVQDRDAFVEDVRLALYASKVVAYSQGFDQIAAASAEYGWDIDRGAMARIWRGGCIIRARFLNRITEAYERDAQLPLLLADEYFTGAVGNGLAAWRRVVAQAALNGVPTPAFSSSLAYYDGVRAERLPAALIQAQRDFFGAHTYRRVDKPGVFHTEWSGDRTESDA